MDHELEDALSRVTRPLRPGEIWWMAVRFNDKPLGRFPCTKDREIALLAAHLMWGYAVDYVQSEVSFRIAEEEKRIPPHRRVVEDDPDTGDCA